MADPWNEGFKACQRGDEESANPHMAGTEDHRRWLAGWTDLAQHNAAKGECLSFLFEKPAN